MRLRKSTIILGNNSRPAKTPNRWDKAIADAAELIEESKREQRELKRSIELLKRLRDAGAALPGESTIGRGREG